MLKRREPAVRARAAAAAALLLAMIVGSSAVEQSPATDDPVRPLAVTQVAEGIFVATGPHEIANPANADFISNAGFIIGDGFVAVVDTGGSFGVGQRLLAAIRSRTDAPIRYVIATHDHPDHLFGNAAFIDTGAQFVGHHNLPEALAARAPHYLEATRTLIGDRAFAGTRAIAPTVLVEDRMELDLGGRHLVVEAWPTAHTDTDLTVYDERTGTWFLGDLLFSGHIPALDGSLKGWLAAIDRLATRIAVRVVPGHGPAVMAWPGALEPMKRYLDLLEHDVRDSLRAGRTMRETAGDAAQVERANWALFDEFNARNATSAYHELEWE